MIIVGAEHPEAEQLAVYAATTASANAYVIIVVADDDPSGIAVASSDGFAAKVRLELAVRLPKKSKQPEDGEWWKRAKPDLGYLWTGTQAVRAPMRRRSYCRRSAPRWRRGRWRAKS